MYCVNPYRNVLKKGNGTFNDYNIFLSVAYSVANGNVSVELIPLAKKSSI